MNRSLYRLTVIAAVLFVTLGFMVPRSAEAVTYPTVSFTYSSGNIYMGVCGNVNHLRLTWGQSSPKPGWSHPTKYLGSVINQCRSWLVFTQVNVNDNLWARVEVSDYSNFPPMSPTSDLRNYTLIYHGNGYLEVR